MVYHIYRISYDLVHDVYSKSLVREIVFNERHTLPLDNLLFYFFPVRSLGRFARSSQDAKHATGLRS